MAILVSYSHLTLKTFCGLERSNCYPKLHRLSQLFPEPNYWSIDTQIHANLYCTGTCTVQCIQCRCKHTCTAVHVHANTHVQCTLNADTETGDNTCVVLVSLHEHKHTLFRNIIHTHPTFVCWSHY